MKITLIQPRSWKRKPRFVYEPLGLGYLVSYLKVHGYADISVKLSIFDTDEEIINEGAKADIVGITAMSPMMLHGRQLAQAIKKKNRNAIVVFGGIHPSICPDTTFDDENIDIVCRGEGEITFYELIDALHKGKGPEDIEGISYRKEKIVVHNKDRLFQPDLDKFPPPDRAAIRQSSFIKLFSSVLGIRMASVLASRGCPFKCSYCATKYMWSRHIRQRSPENVIEEIKGLVTDYGVKDIMFVDDTFTINKDRVVRFCELLNQKNMKISWSCNVHPNTADEQMFGKMKQAGCRDIWIGVESGSDEILKGLKRSYSVDDIKRLFKLTKEIGFKRLAYIMVGTPEESRQTLIQTENLINEIKPDFVVMSFFVPTPGSELYAGAKEKGYVSDNMDWSDLDHLDWSDLNAIHSRLPGTRHLSRVELLKLTNALYNRMIVYMERPKFSLIEVGKIILKKLKTTSFKDYPKLIPKSLRYIKRPGYH